MMYRMAGFDQQATQSTGQMQRRFHNCKGMNTSGNMN